MEELGRQHQKAQPAPGSRAWPNAGGFQHRPQRDREGPTRPGPPLLTGGALLRADMRPQWFCAPTTSQPGTRRLLNTDSYSPSPARGWARGCLCWAAALMALATRGQQAPTGSLPRGGAPQGPLSLQPDGSRTDLPCGHRASSERGHCSSRRRPTYGEQREPSPKPVGRKRTESPSPLQCLVVQLGGSVLAGAQADVKENSGGGTGEEGGQERGEAGWRPQATGAPGPGHISVRMSMRLLRPER